MKNEPTSPAPVHRLVGQMYRCNNCGWYGDKIAHCMAVITGGQYARDTVSMSVCPHCAGLFSTLKRVFTPGANPPNPQDHRAGAVKP